MMKKIKIIGLLLSSLFLLVSCNQAKVFEDYEDIDGCKWAAGNIVVFDVEIEDPYAPYDIELAIRHTTYYAWANIKVNFTIVFPSGSERTIDQDLFLKKNDGSFVGEGAGDLWDITFPMYENISLTEKGKYTFKIMNTMPYAVTDDIMQVGLVVSKSK